MFINILLLIIGMALLLKASDILLDGASSLARLFKISELAIGLLILGLGTSAPEFIISLSASIRSHSDISLGNVIGSNNFNLFFILGLAGLIAPVAVQKKTVRIEIPFYIFSVILLYVLANISFFSDGEKILSRIDGAVLLFFFILFLVYVYKNMKKVDTGVDTYSGKTYSLIKTILFIIFGLGFLIIGGEIVVRSAVALAHTFGISEKIIGITIISVGTSLPELVTTIGAIIKKRDDLAIGTIIGSNIFNILMIIGISSLASPIKYSLTFNIDIYVILIGALFLFIAMFTGKKNKLDRWEALVLVLLYILYVIYLIVKNE